jgi:phosphatidate phosphatase APP1
MENWKSKFQNAIGEIDDVSDSLRARLRKIGDFGDFGDELTIVSYLGYGTADKFILSGRVLEDKGAIATSDTDSRWENLRNLYRRFATDEVAGARVRARFQTVETEIVADAEGYFNVELNAGNANGSDVPFREVELELLEPSSENGQMARAIGRVLVPPATAKFGVISDLDDTVIVTNVTNRLKMFLTVALLNEHTRLPFKGVAAFYRALQNGATGAENNPIFYVSSSPWNLYSPLAEFLRIHKIPLGALFLKDFGNQTVFAPGDHESHKLNNIETILDTYPHLPFVLIGDSGERDPEIYRETVKKYRERIRAVYIRSIDTKSERVAAIDRLIKEIAETGCQLVLAPDTVFAAAHAAAEKLISTDALSAIREEKRENEFAPSAREIGEEEI